MMNIWIINQHSMPADLGNFNRHYNLGKYLDKNGNNVTIFVGSFLHNTDIQMIKSKEKFIKYDKVSFDYYFVRTCSYANSKIKRVKSMFQFCKNVKRLAKKLAKPDVIIGSSAHPLNASLALKLAKKYKCQSIVEIRDLWPKSLIDYGLIKEKSLIAKYLYHFEKKLYVNADKVIFTMEGGKDYISERKMDIDNGGKVDLNKIYNLNNGVDLKEFDLNKNKYIYDQNDFLNKNTIKITYTGSLRMVNNVIQIVDVAERFRNDEKIKFYIFGAGYEEKKIKKEIEEKNLSNVIMCGYVEKKYIPNILSNSYINIFFGKQVDLFRFGMSFNKQFDYFASGKPLISSIKFNYSLIDRYNAGTELVDANPDSIYKAIEQYVNMSKEEYDVICSNSRKAAEKYDYANLAKELEKIIKE